jgi:hypothetical protein
MITLHLADPARACESRQAAVDRTADRLDRIERWPEPAN